MSDPNPNNPRNLWQNQETEKMTVTIDEIRHRASRFERRVRWRNIREYTAGALVVALLGRQMPRLHGWRLLPVALLLAATFYVMFQLHKRGGVRRTPAEMGLDASLRFHRIELERQRDALRTVWRWYLLPMAPGFAAVQAMSAIDRGIGPLWVAMSIFFAGILVGVGALNEWGARKLDQKIQEIRDLEESEG